MTEQPQTEPEDKRAEALMDQAAGDLRSHMSTALANLNRHRELLANRVGAGLINLPALPERPDLGNPRGASAPRAAIATED